jgi:glutaredoxin
VGAGRQGRVFVSRFLRAAPRVSSRAGGGGGRGRRALPQVYLGERYLGGAEELAAMDRSGELDRLLSESA